MFNALKYTQEMEKAGFTREQAEVSVRLLIDVMNESFATKSDLKEMELCFRADLRETELKLESSIKDLHSGHQASMSGLQGSIRESEYKMTIRLGTMMTLAIGVTATLIKML